MNENVKTNLMDVLVLLLKAAMLATNKRDSLKLTKTDIMSAEDYDLDMRRVGNKVELRLRHGSGGESKIIVPNGQSPLTIIQ